MQKIIIVIIFFASSYIYCMDYTQKSSTIAPARFVLTDSQQPKVGMKLLAAVDLGVNGEWRQVWPVVSFVNTEDISTFKVLEYNGMVFEEALYSKDKHGSIYFITWSDRNIIFSDMASYAHQTEAFIPYTSEIQLYKLQVSTIKAYARSLTQTQALKQQTITIEKQAENHVKAVVACVVAGTFLCGSMWWWLENNNKKSIN